MLYIAAMLRKDAKIELLKNVPLFSHCNKKQLTAIAGLADLVDLQTSDASLLVVTDRQFWGLLEQSPEIQKSVLKALGERLQPLVV